MGDKKEIGILTFHNACNYGAFLQAKALKDKISGYPNTKVYIIDYRNQNIVNDYSITGIFKSSKGVKVKLLKILRIKDIIKRNRIFKKFQEETFEYISYDNKKVIENLSKVIVGSDQVWGMRLTGNDETYFLPFVEPKKKGSYAASAGKVDEDFPVEVFENNLRDFVKISVREYALYIKLIQLGFADKLILCVDPVFLKSKAEWRKYAGGQLLFKKPYLLIFIMGVSKQANYIVNRAIQVGRDNGYEIILLGDQERWYKYRNVKHYGVATPKEFVNLIGNAKCVFTNSFHATAFSIILNTSFYIEMNIENNERLLSLLQITGLESRKMFDGKLKSSYSEKIEWNAVEEKIGVEIQKSCDYIEKIIFE